MRTNVAILFAPARPGDAEHLAGLLAEVEHYYGASDDPPLAQWAEHIRAMLFRPEPPARVLLAWDDGRLIGLASYSFVWPAAGVTHSLYLKELYVTESSRKRGVGRTLMRELYRIATENGCSRVEWTADTDNPQALQFYAALGVPPNPMKQNYRVAVAPDSPPSWAVPG
jgi:GNAT superfamily N-acetyltransferase